MLADYGVPVARTVAAADMDGMLAAAGRLGYPVALKTASASHKTDLGGVVLGVEDEEALASGLHEMSARLGPAVTVQEMVEPGVEMALGVVRDPQFGPLIMVAAGGVLIETLRDRRLALPPVDEARAIRLIDGLAVRPLLDGVRGAPPSDLAALVGRDAAVSAGRGPRGPHRGHRHQPDGREPAGLRGRRCACRAISEHIAVSKRKPAEALAVPARPTVRRSGPAPA